MAVVVDSGPIVATDKPEKVPREKWGILMDARRSFLKINMSHDCRCLVGFVDDAEVMYEALGFKSAEDMIEHGYELSPGEIAIATEWLRINQPDQPVNFETANRRGLSELMVKTKPAAKHGTNQHTRGVANGTSSKGSNHASYLAARIKRDRPDIAAAVERGDLNEQGKPKFPSMRSAAIAAGIVKVKTPLENLQAAWKKTNEEDRGIFLTSIGAVLI